MYGRSARGKIEKVRVVLVNNDRIVRDFPPDRLARPMNGRPISIRGAYVVRLISFPYRCVSSTAGGREPSLSALSLLDRSDHFREKSTATRMRARAYLLDRAVLMQCGLTCVARIPALSPD
jgi:hypothetical protein